MIFVCLYVCVREREIWNTPRTGVNARGFQCHLSLQKITVYNFIVGSETRVVETLEDVWRKGSGKESAGIT